MSHYYPRHVYFVFQSAAVCIHSVQSVKKCKENNTRQRESVCAMKHSQVKYHSHINDTFVLRVVYVIKC